MKSGAGCSAQHAGLCSAWLLRCCGKRAHRAQHAECQFALAERTAGGRCRCCSKRARGARLHSAGEHCRWCSKEARSARLCCSVEVRKSSAQEDRDSAVRRRKTGTQSSAQKDQEQCWKWRRRCHRVQQRRLEVEAQMPPSTAKKAHHQKACKPSAHPVPVSQICSANLRLLLRSACQRSAQRVRSACRHSQIWSAQQRRSANCCQLLKEACQQEA